MAELLFCKQRMCVRFTPAAFLSNLRSHGTQSVAGGTGYGGIMSDNEVVIEPRIRVTRIGTRWHARLLWKGQILDEMSCELQCDIGWMCREMLRWYCKLGGGDSAYADAARTRQMTATPPQGGVLHEMYGERRRVGKTL